MCAVTAVDDCVVLEVLTDPTPEALHRVTSILAHQRAEVRHLNFSSYQAGRDSYRVLIHVGAASVVVEQLVKRLRRALRVRRANWALVPCVSAVSACVFEVDAAASSQAAVLQTAAAMGARTIRVEPSATTIGMVGSVKELEALQAALRSLGSVIVSSTFSL